MRLGSTRGRAQQAAPRPASVDREALRAARRVARELIADGGLAVVLTGSHARGEAHPESDIDLVALFRAAGAGEITHPSKRLGRFLVVTASETPATVRAAFRDPKRLGTYVPGWRDAVILADPRGVARRLQTMAQTWSWEPVASVCDEWVAEEITGFAEEVHKLVSALERREDTKAAVQRAVLSLRMASIVAIRRRLLYGTENALWDLAAESMPAEWARAQRLAMAIARTSPEEGCRAALRLYLLTAAEVLPLLDRSQRAVVEHACTLAERASR